MNIEKCLEQVDISKLLKTDHPMVREFRFIPNTSVKSTSVYADVWGYGEDSFHFSLEIHLKPGVRYLQQRDEAGERVTPVERVTTGEETVGRGNRVLFVKDGELCAENSTFFPDQEFNDLGIGSSFYVAQERLYRALGIRYVRLLAAFVGRYLWARQGFKFASPTQAGRLKTQFRHFLRGCGVPPGLSPIQESWDLVNYRVAGLERDGYGIGKYFALKTFPCWEGFKCLDERDHNQIAIASRVDTFSRLPEKIPGHTTLLDTF